MYFKKLEIIGFKSFYNKTTLHFEPGVTAIVGPNGCGKSNIFDSIRWVLGEQSPKSMRGSQMEDVIFNGTDTKEPLSLAEVSLSFDNSNKFFPVDHNEVVITRRIFRSGESEYLLNKTQVRLKDILDLLMGTGIGAESYSIIPQGKIDLILSSRPEDRRLVFDEASGVTKYKSQKREALRKIEETEQNLLRVNDIIVEVKRQIGSLERQANKARRYKEVFEDLKLRELKLASKQKKELEINRAEIEKELENLQKQENFLADIIIKQESGLLNSQTELKNLENTISKINTEILNLKNLVSRNNERAGFNKERITELENNKVLLTAQLGLAQERLSLDQEKYNSFEQECVSIKKNIEEKTLLLKEKEIRLSDISAAIKSFSGNLAEQKKSILELASKAANAKNEVAEFTSKQQIFLARQKRLEIEKAKVNEEKTAVESENIKITGQLNLLEKDFQELSLKISAIKNELDSEKNALSGTNLSIENLEKQKLSLQSQKQFLEELKTKYEDISESMSAVIYLDKMPQKKITGLVIKIKDYMNLGEDERKNFGAVNLKVSGEAKPFDLDPQNINERIALIEKNIADFNSSKLEKESKIALLNKNLSEIEESSRAQEMAIVNKKASLQSIVEQFNKIKDEESLINLELSDMENELTAINSGLVRLQSELNNFENEKNSTEDSVSNEQNNISEHNLLKEETLVIIAQIKTELDTLNKRVNSDSGTLKMMEERLTQDKESLSGLQKQIVDSSAKHSSLTEEIKELENNNCQIEIDIKDHNASLNEIENEFREISETLNEAVKKIGSDKIELDSIKGKVYELQMQSKEAEFNLLSLKDRLLQAYKIDIGLIVDAPQDESAEIIDLAAVTEEIKSLKQKLDSYGSVNLVAIEEYDELKKRYDFLTQQQTDLIDAKDSLHEAILKINRTTKKMFLETFEKIRVEFRNYFKLLFNGGDAQVYLVDEQDPLESGIEIICRPPGKKLQNVLLLSGGEKSMSAIALIFAIFKIKPAPFCVLDEIDAALDEANVDRFGRVLQEFINTSQFIVITHNKKTIANADIMYGITMEESGISKIVSVKFAQNKTLQQQNPEAQPVAEPV